MVGAEVRNRSSRPAALKATGLPGSHVARPSRSTVSIASSITSTTSTTTSSTTTNTTRTRTTPTPTPTTRRPALATHTAVGIVVVLLALVSHFFAPHLPHSILHYLAQHHRASPASSPSNPPVLSHQPPVSTSPTQHVEFAGTFYTNPERSMALAQQAKRVAAEFDFTTDAVNKAVAEFIREMGMRAPASPSPTTTH